MTGRKSTLLAVLLLPLSITGCASESYLGARTVVVQGKFDHMTCVELAATHKTHSTRIEELTRFIDKAATEPGGGVIGTAVHGPTLAEARGNRRIVEETQAEKKCEREAAKP